MELAVSKPWMSAHVAFDVARTKMRAEEEGRGEQSDDGRTSVSQSRYRTHAGERRPRRHSSQESICNRLVLQSPHSVLLPVLPAPSSLTPHLLPARPNVELTNPKRMPTG